MKGTKKDNRSLVAESVRSNSIPSREMEKTVAYISLLLLLSGSSNCQCIENLPEFRDQGKMSPALSLNEIQAVIPAYKISCRGVIVQWGVVTEKRGGHLIELQVWRETTSHIYSKVGGNWFDQGPAKGQKLLYFTPNLSDLISVEPGDFIGLYSIHTPEIEDNYGIQYESSRQVQILYFRPNSSHLNFIDPAHMHSEDVALLLYLDISQQHPSHVTTYNGVSLTITPTGPNSPTDSHKLHMQQHKQLKNSAIIGSTAGFLLVVLVAVVVGAFLLLLYSRRHKKKLQTNASMNYERGLKSEPVSMVVTENPAYGEHLEDSPAHEYEILSPTQVKPKGQPSPTESHYETMAAIEESSEYMVMESSTYEPIYEELT